MTGLPAAKVTIPSLQAMKPAGQKSVCLVVWDCQMARIADRIGVEIISVGDSVGVNLWGRTSPLDVTLEEMILLARAVRTGVTRSLLSCDFPYGPLQQGPADAVRAAVRLAKEAGVDLVKLDGAADFPDAVEAVTRAGVPVFAQLGVTPQTALKYGVENPTSNAVPLPDDMVDQLVVQAKRLESAGAVALNFTNSGPLAGSAVASAVSIPVLGGLGGGPWLDGRIRRAQAALGYNAENIDLNPDTYLNLGRLACDALSECVADIRAGRHIRGENKA